MRVGRKDTVTGTGTGRRGDTALRACRYTTVGLAVTAGAAMLVRTVLSGVVLDAVVAIAFVGFVVTALVTLLLWCAVGRAPRGSTEPLIVNLSRAARALVATTVVAAAVSLGSDLLFPAVVVVLAGPSAALSALLAFWFAAAENPHPDAGGRRGGLAGAFGSFADGSGGDGGSGGS